VRHAEAQPPGLVDPAEEPEAVPAHPAQPHLPAPDDLPAPGTRGAPRDRRLHVLVPADRPALDVQEPDLGLGRRGEHRTEDGGEDEEAHRVEDYTGRAKRVPIRARCAGPARRSSPEHRIVRVP
jgi:hypothetical protein